MIDYFSWRTIFYAPVPLAIIGLIFGPIFIPGDRPRGALPRFDWSSYILLCITLCCLISILSNSQRWGCWEFKYYDLYHYRRSDHRRLVYQNTNAGSCSDVRLFRFSARKILVLLLLFRLSLAWEILHQVIWFQFSPR